MRHSRDKLRGRRVHSWCHSAGQSVQGWKESIEDVEDMMEGPILTLSAFYEYNYSVIPEASSRRSPKKPRKLAEDSTEEVADDGFDIVIFCIVDLVTAEIRSSTIVITGPDTSRPSLEARTYSKARPRWRQSDPWATNNTKWMQQIETKDAFLVADPWAG